MEPEGSLPYSQVPATCPYPELTPSSPHDPLQDIKLVTDIYFDAVSMNRDSVTNYKKRRSVTGLLMKRFCNRNFPWRMTTVYSLNLNSNYT
jgi:hypothetical protein